MPVVLRFCEYEDSAREGLVEGVGFLGSELAGGWSPLYCVIYAINPGAISSPYILKLLFSVL